MGTYVRAPESERVVWIDGLDPDPGWVQPGTVWASHFTLEKTTTVLAVSSSELGGTFVYFQVDGADEQRMRTSRFLEIHIPVGRPGDFKHLIHGGQQ